VARLAIDRDFLDDYSELPKSVQGSVKMAIDKFAEYVHAGLHLEKLTRCKDDRIRTIRIDAMWRGVVLAPDEGDTYSLIRVMPHDKAIEYAGSRRFSVNEALAVIEVRDQAALEQVTPTLEQAALMRTCVPAGPNDMLIEGTRQRIYDIDVSLDRSHQKTHVHAS
jgi:hypothetical protein